MFGNLGDIAEIGKQVKEFMGNVFQQITLLHQKIDWIAHRVDELYKAEQARKKDAAEDVAVIPPHDSEH